MRILLNGTTGLLGRNLLFEILKKNIGNLDKIELILLGKSIDRLSFKERMKEIIQGDGFDYLKLDINNDLSLFDEIISIMTFIEYDLTLPDLRIAQDDFAKLKTCEIDHFFHVAALTNFFNTPEITAQLNLINFEGTKNILSLIRELNVGQINNISTAYSSGASINEILPDYVNNSGIFRNPYEKSKLNAELYLLNFAKQEKLRNKIFRISTLGGRLIENEIGSTSKFDVFYQWAAFFLKYKAKKLKSTKNIYKENMLMNLRIAAHPKSTLNICPADYAAKLVYNTALSENSYKSFHIVNETDIPTEKASEIIFEALNINGYSFVDSEPKDKNPFEEMYYRSVGKIFTPYIIDQPLRYLNYNLQEVIRDNNLTCPEMDSTNFSKLIDYAKRHNFGLSHKI